MDQVASVDRGRGSDGEAVAGRDGRSDGGGGEGQGGEHGEGLEVLHLARDREKRMGLRKDV